MPRKSVTSAGLKTHLRRPTTRSRTKQDPAAIFEELAPRTRRPPPAIGQRSIPPRSTPFNEKWWSDTFDEFVEKDANGAPKAAYIDTEAIPDFGLDGEGLGEPLFDEDPITHKTVRHSGYVVINAIGDEDLEMKREKRKKSEKARRLGVRKARRAKNGGGVRRGPDGRFIKAID